MSLPTPHGPVRRTDPLTRALSWLALGGLLGLTGVLAARAGSLQGHLADLEARRTGEEFLHQRELFRVGQDLKQVRARVASSEEEAMRADELARRLASTEADMQALVERISRQEDGLMDLRTRQEALDPDRLRSEVDHRVDGLRSELDRRWHEALDLVSSAREAAFESSEELARLEDALPAPRDYDGMWRDLVGPVVQLAGEESVGSGVLLRSQPADGGGFRTHLLTAWHVVRDIQVDLDHRDMPVPTFIYSQDGTVTEEFATLLEYDPEIDVALLVLETQRPFPNGAELAPRSVLASVRIFDPVYAVGCPLGNDPIPTHGEISTTSQRVDGQTYWMINAPTYVGNSGGGIFEDETHELLGIFSKIYTHGTLRPTIVPHMGLATPLTVIYDWLEREGHGELIPDDPVQAAGARTASASEPGRAGAR